MMHDLRRSFPVFATLALVAGCFGSKPTRFYMLSSLAPAGGAVESGVGARVIALGPVSIPDYVDRPQIVVREGTNQVELAGFDHWAGSLSDMVARVLLEDLSAQLPGDHVVAFPEGGAAAFDYRVAVQIGRFDVGTAGDAVVAASWRVWDRAGSKTRLTASTTVPATAPGSSYQDRVAALSQAVADLAADIARSLARLEPERSRR
jgi:uncharacterized lipoprotein YmbA